MDGCYTTTDIYRCRILDSNGNFARISVYQELALINAFQLINRLTPLHQPQNPPSFTLTRAPELVCNYKFIIYLPIIQ